MTERDRGSRGVHGRRSMRSNRKIRRRLETRREGNTMEGENLHSITNGHLLICDLILKYSKGLESKV